MPQIVKVAAITHNLECFIMQIYSFPFKTPNVFPEKKQVIIIYVYTFAMSWVGYKLIDCLIPIRVSAYSERVGLDFSQHDEHYGLAHIGERELAEYEEHIREKNK